MKKMLLTLAALFAAATTAFADLYVTPTGAGAKDGSSWANAYAGIQAAVDAADAAYAADGTLHEIIVGDGTYTRVVVSRDFALQVRSVNGAARFEEPGSLATTIRRNMSRKNTKGASPTWGRALYYLVNEEHLAILRERPTGVGDTPFKLIHRSADGGHGGDDR